MKKQFPDRFNDYVTSDTGIMLLEAVALAKICDAGRYGPEAGKAEETLQTEAGELLKKIDKELA